MNLLQEEILREMETAGGRLAITEMVSRVRRATGSDALPVVAAMWDMVDLGWLEYGTDAVVRLVSAP